MPHLVHLRNSLRQVNVPRDVLTSNKTFEGRALGKGTTLTDRLRGDLDILRRHITVLQAVEERQPVGIMRLAKLLGVPQHRVRYALRVLEQDGLIRPSRAGAVTTKKAKRFHAELRNVLNEMKETIETLKNSL